MVWVRQRSRAHGGALNLWFNNLNDYAIATLRSTSGTTFFGIWDTRAGASSRSSHGRVSQALTVGGAQSWVEENTLD